MKKIDEIPNEVNPIIFNVFCMDKNDSYAELYFFPSGGKSLLFGDLSDELITCSVVPTNKNAPLVIKDEPTFLLKSKIPVSVKTTAVSTNMGVV
ncbi:MAG: hypothetical protein FWC41_12460, partial [Firmicutes bacterium]|nr:hypothetical protein [Bacillota bacterium]